MAKLSLADLETFDPGAKHSGRERRFCCPLCGRAKPKDALHRSLSVNTTTGLWTCHRCGDTGLLTEYHQKPALARENGKPKPDQLLGISEPKQRELPDAGKSEEFLRLIQRLESCNGSDAEAYLAQRGISSSKATKAGVKYAPDWGGHPAVVFPIVGPDLKIVAGTGRYIVGAPIMTRTYGLKKDGVFVTSRTALDTDPLVIVEAPIDALTLATVGLEAIATCGVTKTGDFWPDWLPAKLFGRSVYLGFDADEAGDKAAQTLGAALITWSCRVYRLRPPAPYKDWNEMLQAGDSSKLSAIAARVRQA